MAAAKIQMQRCLATYFILEIVDDEERSWVRGKTRNWIKRRPEKGYFNNIVRELMIEDTAGYREMIRMQHDDFKKILGLIECDISRQQVLGGHHIISAAERLTLTLRFLATGESYRSLSFQFRISRAAISYIVKEVCEVISKRLGSVYLKVPQSQEDWLKISKQFEERWQYPHCIGAIDGKHIVMVPPCNSGSYFYNYKHTHSIVLLAVAGPDYECLYADVGTNGRISDGGVWNKCGLARAIESNTVSLPLPACLPDGVDEIPYVLVGDDAFALKPYMMKPYPQQGLSIEKRIYNYRHSKARRISENLFGILANRWRFLRTILHLPPDTVRVLTMAAVNLHNYLRKSSSRSIYTPVGVIDREDSNGELVPGLWRQDVATDSFFPLCVPTGGHNTSVNAKLVRQSLMEYFCTDGAIDWQWEKC